MARPAETAAHRELKRLALAWAREQGYRIAAAEVGLPHHRVRMDVAACRTSRGRIPTLETVAIFECKAFTSDFRRDGRSMEAIRGQLARLHARRERIEVEIRRFYPSIHTGDSLFPEYETLDYRRPGHRRYEAVMDEIQRLSAQLHANTKFDRLQAHGAANLFYVVVEPGILKRSELPAGWGLLERDGTALQLLAKPAWNEIDAQDRLAFALRIAMAATRAVHREHGTGRLPSPETLDPGASTL